MDINALIKDAKSKGPLSRLAAVELARHFQRKLGYAVIAGRKG